MMWPLFKNELASLSARGIVDPHQIQICLSGIPVLRLFSWVSYVLKITVNTNLN